MRLEGDIDGEETFFFVCENCNKPCNIYAGDKEFVNDIDVSHKPSQTRVSDRKDWEKEFDFLWEMDGKTYERIKFFISQHFIFKKEAIKKLEKEKKEAPELRDLPVEVAFKEGFNEALDKAIQIIEAL